MFSGLWLTALRLFSTTATLTAAWGSGFGVVIGIGTRWRQCTGFFLPGPQRLRECGSLVGHQGGKVLLLIRIISQVEELNSSPNFEELNQLEVPSQMALEGVALPT